VDGTTHYNEENVRTFFQQAQRLKSNYGFEAVQVFTGAEIISRLIEETERHGRIESLAIFMHGGPNSLFLSNNQGLYDSEVNQKPPQNGGSASLGDLKYRMDLGQIKFSSNAICFLNSCNSAYDRNYGLARDFTLLTGVTTIGCSGTMEMKDPKNANGEFITNNGGFYRLTRFKSMDWKVVPNPNKAWWEIWKSDTINVQIETYKVKTEYLGNEIKIDDYVY
jgi:hypothetical protein